MEQQFGQEHNGRWTRFWNSVKQRWQGSFLHNGWNALINGVQGLMNAVKDCNCYNRNGNNDKNSEVVLNVSHIDGQDESYNRNGNNDKNSEVVLNVSNIDVQDDVQDKICCDKLDKLDKLYGDEKYVVYTTKGGDKSFKLSELNCYKIDEKVQNYVDKEFRSTKNCVNPELAKAKTNLLEYCQKNNVDGSVFDNITIEDLLLYQAYKEKYSFYRGTGIQNVYLESALAVAYTKQQVTISEEQSYSPCTWLPSFAKSLGLSCVQTKVSNMETFSLNYVGRKISNSTPVKSLVSFDWEPNIYDDEDI